MKRFLKTFLIAWTTAFACSCGGGGSDDNNGGGLSPDEATIILSEARDLFSAGSYADAYTHYATLFTTGKADSAHAGAGWCKLRLSDYALASGEFSQSTSIDAHAGLVFTGWATGSLDGAISEADYVLGLDANYTLSYDSRVTKTHLIWIQAACYFQKNQYANCLAKIQLLDSGFTADVNSPSIKEILAAKLETLGAAM